MFTFLSKSYRKSRINKVLMTRRNATRYLRVSGILFSDLWPFHNPVHFDFPTCFLSSSSPFLRFYLFIFREGGSEGERKEEKHLCVTETLLGCLLDAPNWGPGLQPRYVP